MVSYHYVYATNGSTIAPGTSLVGTGELTAAQAEEIYRMQVGSLGSRAQFAVIRVDEATGRHVAVLEVAPGANGVRLRVVDDNKSVEVIYRWGAFFVPRFKESKPAYQGNVDTIFLPKMVNYGYPDEPRGFGENEADVVVTLDFFEDGESHVTIKESLGLGKGMATETTKYKDVDLSPHYYKIPEFGHWDELFNAHEPFAQEYALKNK